MRVVVLGVGSMGRVHARALGQSATGLELVGFYDPDPGATPTPSVPGARRFATEGEAILAADVVVVASPIAAHAASAHLALAAGRHALVEKPLAATPEDAASLVEAARAASCRLFVGHSERFNPVVRELARRVAPTAITSLAFRRVGAARARDALLLNLGVHDIDLASYLTRSPLMPRSARGDDDAVDVVLSAARGARVALHFARGGDRQRSIVVETRDEVFRGDLARFELTVTSRRTGATRRVPVDADAEPIVLQARALARALEGALEPELASGRDAARTVHVAAACASSLVKGRDGAPRGLSENL